MQSEFFGCFGTGGRHPMSPAPCGKPSPEPPAKQRRGQDCIRALTEDRQVAYPREDLRQTIVRLRLAPDRRFEIEVYGAGLNWPLVAIDQRASGEGVASRPLAEPAKNHQVRDIARPRPKCSEMK